MGKNYNGDCGAPAPKVPWMCLAVLCLAVPCCCCGCGCAGCGAVLCGAVLCAVQCSAVQCGVRCAVCGVRCAVCVCVCVHGLQFVADVQVRPSSAIAPHRTAPHCTAPHRTGPHRTYACPHICSSWPMYKLQATRRRRPQAPPALLALLVRCHT